MNQVIPLTNLIARFALRENLSEDESRRFVTTFFSIVEDALSAGNDVAIKNMGIFSVKNGRAVFVADPAFASKVNEPFEMFSPMVLGMNINVADVMSDVDSAETEEPEETPQTSDSITVPDEIPQTPVVKEFEEPRAAEKIEEVEVDLSLQPEIKEELAPAPVSSEPAEENVANPEPEIIEISDTEPVIIEMSEPAEIDTNTPPVEVKKESEPEPVAVEISESEPVVIEVPEPEPEITIIEVSEPEPAVVSERPQFEQTSPTSVRPPVSQPSSTHIQNENPSHQTTLYSTPSTSAAATPAQEPVVEQKKGMSRLSVILWIIFTFLVGVWIGMMIAYFALK